MEKKKVLQNRNFLEHYRCCLCQPFIYLLCALIRAGTGLRKASKNEHTIRSHCLPGTLFQKEYGGQFGYNSMLSFSNQHCDCSSCLCLTWREVEEFIPLLIDHLSFQYTTLCYGLSTLFQSRNPQYHSYIIPPTAPEARLYRYKQLFFFSDYVSEDYCFHFLFSGPKYHSCYHPMPCSAKHLSDFGCFLFHASPSLFKARGFLRSQKQV